MKRPPYFARLTGTAGLWQPQKPAFAGLAQQSLGNSGSPADGTDSRILDLLNAFSSSSSLLDAITLSGTQLAAAKTAADSIPMGDIGPAIDAATAASAGGITKIGAALGLLAQSPTALGGLGPAPSPPTDAIDCTGGTTSSSNSSYLTGAEYAGTTTASAVSLLNSPSMSLLLGATTAAEVGLLITVIGAAVALSLLLVTFFGHGCGQACIDAAKAEQIYEAAADNLAAVYKAGFISLAQALAGIVHLLAAGQQHLSTFGTKQATNGSANMTRVITALIGDVQKEPKPKPKTFNLQSARQDYIYGGNWYPDALQAASELSDEYLKALT